MKAIIKMSLFFPILFCSGASFRGYCDVKFDTIYHYYMRYYEQHLSTVILQNEKALSDFLTQTGFNDDDAIKKPASLPDFSKYTVFAFAGWPCTIIKILEDSAKITVHYQENYRDMDTANGLAYSRPANEAIVYVISRTDKPIEFLNVSRKK